MPSIYRKYRPKTFAEMVGQNHIKLTLEHELEDETFVQAYLFCGPRGLGKTTAARLFAKAVNCENRKKGEFEPCNKCSSCEEINNGRAVDMIEIDAASHTGVDNVRENIIENVRFTPNKSKFKVFIIDEVHMLSISAFNALLKTLEEPPAYVIFILCTTEIHKVPETIISRCQRFDFKKVPTEEAVKRLKKLAQGEGIDIADEVIKTIAAKSEGCMRDAESLLGQVLSIGGKKITSEQAALIMPVSDISLISEFLTILGQKKTAEGLEFIGRLVDEGVDLEVFTREIIDWLRKLVLIQVKAKQIEFLGLNKETEDTFGVILNLMNINSSARMITIFSRALKELKNPIIPSLPLEMAVIEITGDSSNYHGNSPEAGKSTGQNPACKNNPTAALNTNNISQRESKTSSAARDNQQAKTTNEPANISASNIKAGEKEEKLKINKEKKPAEINIKKIKDNWIKIIKTAQSKSRDLRYINSREIFPWTAENGILEVGFQYELHWERFNHNGNKDIFADAVAEVTGQKSDIKAKLLQPSELAEIDMQIEEEENKNLISSGVKVTEDNILENVLASFGGEVVE